MKATFFKDYITDNAIRDIRLHEKNILELYCYRVIRLALHGV